jgi:hypothetical protein
MPLPATVNARTSLPLLPRLHDEVSVEEQTVDLQPTFANENPLPEASSYDVKYFLPSLRARTYLMLPSDQSAMVSGSDQEESRAYGDEDLAASRSGRVCLVISREGSVVQMQFPQSSCDEIWGRWQPMYASPSHHVTQALPVAKFLHNDQELTRWAAAGANVVITEADLDCISRGSLKVDVALRCSVTTSCFTKGYARILRRAGPLLVQRHPASCTYESPHAHPSESTPLVISFRRFTPSEQSRLMCLSQPVPADACVSPQNWYKLLGNSVNVHVCACVLLHMLRDDEKHGTAWHGDAVAVNSSIYSKLLQRNKKLHFNQASRHQRTHHYRHNCTIVQ